MTYFIHTVVVISVAIIFVLIVLQAYVRWTTNQGFTFLGGSELETLTLATFGLMGVFLYRSHVHCVHCLHGEHDTEEIDA